MKLYIHHGDILSLKVELLVCSANVSLNLTGGVGGALLLKYGSEVQHELHNYLKSMNLRFVEIGSVITTSPNCTDYKLILHAVAVDAFYDSNPQVITSVCTKIFKVALEKQITSVAIPLLATGYGNLSIPEFLEGFLESNRLNSQELRKVEKVILSVNDSFSFDEVKGYLEAENIIFDELMT